MRTVIALLALLFSTAAQAEWKFTMAGEGPKFGPSQGGNNFFPFWIYCESDTRKIVINAYIGNQRPAGAQASVSLTAAGEPPVTVQGNASPEAFDGLYSLDAELTRTHPLFALLAKGQPLAYAGGTTRVTLDAQGLAATLQRWAAACR
jgi:hypothetical protein